MNHELKSYMIFEKKRKLSMFEVRARDMQRGKGDMVSWIVHQMR